MPTSKRADLGKVLPAVRCTARRRNGQPCKSMAARGANVCRVHGGSAPQVKRAAQRRLQQAADVLTERLLGFALDGDVPDAIALAAVRDALDRAGLKPGVEIEVTAKPYEEILDNLGALEGGSRAEWRREHGIADNTPTALVASLSVPGADEPIDAELVDDDELSDDGLCATHSDCERLDGIPEPDGSVDSSDGESGPNPFGASPPGTELVPFDQAVSQAADVRRRAAHGDGHAVVRRTQR